ncbi:hypothetical protein [Rothia nasisuis]|nr:hypothetical protein [Rothia nasisuis]
MWLPWVRLKAGVARLFGSELAQGIELTVIQETCTEMAELLQPNNSYSSITNYLRSFPQEIANASSVEQRLQSVAILNRALNSGNASYEGLIITCPGLPQQIDRESQKRFNDLHTWLRRRYESDIYWLKFKDQHQR